MPSPSSSPHASDTAAIPPQSTYVLPFCDAPHMYGKLGNQRTQCRRADQHDEQTRETTANSSNLSFGTLNLPTVQRTPTRANEPSTFHEAP